MNCPVCNEPMTLTNQDTSYNRRENDKPYNRTRYVCSKDDTWVKIEVPQKEVQTQQENTLAVS